MLFKQVKDLKIRRLYKNFENKYNIKKFVLVNLLNRLIVKKFSKNIRKRTIPSVTIFLKKHTIYINIYGINIYYRATI